MLPCVDAVAGADQGDVKQRCQGRQVDKAGNDAGSPQGSLSSGREAVTQQVNSDSRFAGHQALWQQTKQNEVISVEKITI